MELEVAMKYCAVGVVVAPIAPLAFAERSEFVMPVRDRTPAFEKLDVALAPNHAGPYELNKVVDACWKNAVLCATMPPKAILGSPCVHDASYSSPSRLCLYSASKACSSSSDRSAPVSRFIRCPATKLCVPSTSISYICFSPTSSIFLMRSKRKPRSTPAIFPSSCKYGVERITAISCSAVKSPTRVQRYEIGGAKNLVMGYLSPTVFGPLDSPSRSAILALRFFQTRRKAGRGCL